MKLVEEELEGNLCSLIKYEWSINKKNKGIKWSELNKQQKLVNKSDDPWLGWLINILS